MIPARLRGWAGISLSIAGAILVLGGYPAYAVQRLPDPRGDLAASRSVVVYDRNGGILAERSADSHFHVYLHLSQMGRYGPAATLAAEDRGFYEHGALDAAALGRAALADAASGSAVEGGSTITQQLVKIELLSSQKTLARKLQEAYLAWVLERRYSKDQILEMYLNRVYYGHGAYGLGSAAKAYFGATKDASQLTPAQAAFLAGLLEAPNGDDPALHYDLARNRELYVLRGLRSMGVLSASQEQQAEQEDIRSELHFDTSYRETRAPHLVDYVLERLESQLGPAAMSAGGVKVYTTIDPNLQALAENAVSAGVVQLSGSGVNNADLVAARADTGEILAFVGSADYSNASIDGQFDVALARRQPGSSFKAYVYEAALRDRKITLCTTLQDEPTDFGGYRPQDFDNGYLGPISAREALVQSRNIPAVEVAAKEGISNVNRLASQMGVKSPLEANLATAIGASGITMLDNIQGYQVLANQGEKVPLMAITKVVDASGSTLFEQRPGSQPGRQQVVSPAEAYLVTDVLKDYQNVWKLGWNHQMASKSGTSGGSQTGVHNDAWMMAYDPRLVVGAWAGRTGAAAGPVSAFGVNVGSTITARFLNSLPASYFSWYGRPAGITQGRGGELFLSGTETAQGCSPRTGQSEGPAPPKGGGGRKRD